MKPASSRALSRSSVEELLKGVAESARDADVSRRCLCDVFRLPSGAALLVFEDGKGRIYESFDDFLAFLNDPQRSATNIMRSLLPQQERFVDEIPALLRELARVIDVDPAAFDFTVESLHAIDKGLQSAGQAQVLTARIFPPLVAYVGEVVRLKIAGEWKMYRVFDGTSEPDVVDRHGERCWLLRIHKEILEHGAKASVAAFAQVTVAWHESPANTNGRPPQNERPT